MSVPFLVTLFVFIYTRFVKQFVFDIHNQMFHFLWFLLLIFYLSAQEDL